MKARLIFALLVLALSSIYGATTYTSSQSGLWSDNDTWGGAGHPDTDGQTWTIANGHTVVCDTDTSALANGFGASVVNGVLLMTNQATQVYLKMNGSVSGTGLWQIGSPSQAVTNMDTTAYPAVVVAFKSGQITMSASEALAWYGDTSAFSEYSTNTAAVGSAVLEFANAVQNVASNDVIFVSNPQIRGLGGSYHVVSNVTDRVITVWDSVATGSPQTVTNLYPGNSVSSFIFSGTFATSDRTNGTAVFKLSRPVVFIQPVRNITAGGVTTSATNVFCGVRYHNIGTSFLNSLNYCTFTNCVGTGCNGANGGLVSGGSYNTLVGCIFVRGSGMISQSGDCTLINCIAGNGTYGLGYIPKRCRFDGCMAVNCNQGGIAGLPYGCTLTNCIAFNCSSGSWTYWGIDCNILNSISHKGGQGCYMGQGFLIKECLATNNNTGGICAFGQGHVIVDCVVSGNTTGGISDMGTQTIINCLATNQDAPSISFEPSESRIYGISNTIPNAIYYRNSSGAPHRDTFDVSTYNDTNWLSPYGLCYSTNLAQSFTPTVIYHLPNETNRPAVYYMPISVKPLSVRRATLSLFLTNTGGWHYQVTGEREKPLSTAAIIGTDGWTNLPLRVTNILSVPNTKWLWVYSTSTNALHPQMSWVDLQTDSQSAILP